MVHKINGIKNGTTIHGPDSIFYTIADNEVYIKQTQNNTLNGRALFETRMSFDQFTEISFHITQAILEQECDTPKKDLEIEDEDEDEDKEVGTKNDTPNLHKGTLLRSTKEELKTIHEDLPDTFKSPTFNALRKAQMVEFLMQYV